MRRLRTANAAWSETCWAVIEESRDDVEEIVEGLVRRALLFQVACETLRREDAIGGERGATVREAVAGVDDPAGGRQRPALAGLAADRADGLVSPEDPPAGGL